VSILPSVVATVADYIYRERKKVVRESELQRHEADRRARAEQSQDSAGGSEDD